MLFDAGRYGMVDVDKVIDLGDRERGIIHPDGDYNKIIYTRWKKNGACSKSILLPPQDLSAETREQTRREIARIGEELLKNRRAGLPNH